MGLVTGLPLVTGKHVNGNVKGRNTRGNRTHKLGALTQTQTEGRQTYTEEGEGEDCKGYICLTHCMSIVKEGDMKRKMYHMKHLLLCLLLCLCSCEFVQAQQLHASSEKRFNHRKLMEYEQGEKKCISVEVFRSLCLCHLCYSDQMMLFSTHRHCLKPLG